MEVEARLRRYLRVAYEGADAVEPEPRRRAGRWGIGAGTAIRLAMAVLVIGVAAVTYVLLTGRAEAPAAPVAVPVPVTADAVAPSAAPTAEAALVVHVAGAVVTPGVVELAPGTRVDQAIAAAGGPTDDADLDALNLAAPVSDGQQVYVPIEGETVPPAAPGSDSTIAGPSGGGLVDINTADAAALDTLPGVGPAIAARIIAYRDEHGPFASVEALTDVAGIGPATMDRLRDLVTV